MIDLRFAAECTGGSLAGAAPASGQVGGVSIDTRTLLSGDLFVALAGSRSDGHEHLGAARERGAACAMVERYVEAESGLAQLVVGDCVAALGSLAASWRKKFEIAVAAVTGTNGKTTVKEMAAAVMRRALGEGAVLRNEGNLNNHLGVPLTLLRIRPEHACAIVEMGMSAPGEISRLSRMTNPGVAVINNAMRGHLLGVGCVEDVARCKGEIVEGVAAGGTVVVNGDDRHADMWSRLAGGRRVLRFSMKDPNAHAYAGGEDGRMHMRLGGRDSFEVSLAAEGNHNRMNALAAACACEALGASDAQIAAGLGDFRAVPGRMELRAGANGMTVIDDTYNANPDSALEAIAALRARPEPVKMLVFGDMLELGEEAKRLHEEIGSAARGLDGVFTVGDLSQDVARCAGNGVHFASKRELVEHVLERADSGTVVLVKGSRGSAMNEVVDRLLPRAEAT